MSPALLDVIMPHCGGLELTRRIRAVCPALPVILISGYDREQVPGNSKSVAHCEILNKPVQFNDLNSRIRQMLV